MNQSNLWSLRLGFSGKQSQKINSIGIEKFLKESFHAPFENKMPVCLTEDPKTLSELKDFREKVKNTTSEEGKKALKNQIKNSIELRKWWINEIRKQEFPLREKMVLFWHNHFVATSQKVKVNWWIYQNNYLLRENAFSNFRQLTKIMIQTNAMVRYLDNTDNRKGKINENLSRELLELFTLGIGNYTESDIKNGAKALAGLGLGENEAKYRAIFEDNDTITYLGKTGNFKADDLVDIIFEQPNIPYLITRKILKWFIYDNPKEELVKYYGDYLRTVDFEIEALLLKIFTEEYEKNTAGSKIKNPLEYILQLTEALQIKEMDAAIIVFFLKQQGMDLFNQPNVKGWEGGNNWLTAQLYLQRNNASDLLCNGRNINKKAFNNSTIEGEEPKISLEKIDIKINFNPKASNKQIIKELSDAYVFQVDEISQKDMETILKYDFDAEAENAQQAVIRLFNFITRLPEFQLI
ncbi:DUF1800 family protein [Flavobacterium sp. LMO8]|uniref:DUF1800 domain-containing protein n=1 Tax=Flavobacterium sp. LMO8 TaxID=2654244 RepID=UPI0012916D07|nr:DUF1800 domain-containing protein [Flavobacterium sp. LMO8]MQP24808.1 DUF1800 family protein [Flavobacterium sp. LMO8]